MTWAARVGFLREIVLDAWKRLPQGHVLPRPAWTERHHRALYQAPPSITDEFPWMAFDPNYGVIVFENGMHCGALLELTPLPTEGRDADSIERLQLAVWEAIKDGVPEETPPWVVQFYAHDEPSLLDIQQALEAAVDESARDSAFTRHWFEVLERHFQQVVAPQGLFLDAGQPWRGKRRRYFCTLYRRARYPNNLAAMRECHEVGERFATALGAAGVGARRCTGRDLHDWLLPWLTPWPESAEGDPYRYLREAPYPNEFEPESMPFGFDIAGGVTPGTYTSLREGIWMLSQVPCRALALQDLRQIPTTGHLTGERPFGETRATLLDRLPEHARLALTIVVQPQFELENHLQRIIASAVGDSAQAAQAKDEARVALAERAAGEKLFPASLVVYLRAAGPNDREDLALKVKQALSVLRTEGLAMIEPRHDLFALNTYLRHLPFCFDAAQDARLTRRSRRMYSQHLAAMAPVYGRATGTRNPAMVVFNRGAEAFGFDPLRDRRANAHGIILGPTGSGKSAFLINQIGQWLAIHRPRVFIIDPKWPAPSFRLMLEHLGENGLHVHRITLTPNADIALNPFAMAHCALEAKPPGSAEYGEDTRDVLGEMVLLAKTMITGGEAREIERLSRADVATLRDAILRAARQASPDHQVLTQDVRNSLRQIATENEGRRSRIAEMADALDHFCAGLPGKLFNRPSTPLPDTDVTLIELASLTQDGNEGELTAAFMVVLLEIQARVDQWQYDRRETIVVADEMHLIARNPFLGPFVTRIVKVWRSVGTWFWQATQNFGDFDAAMHPLLNNLEWWICLSMGADEIRDIGRFRDLTDEQKAMLANARKAPGKYVEGVVLHDSVQALFRAVVPPLVLALAQTELAERAHRADIMERESCSELRAAHIVAEDIERARAAGPEIPDRRWS